MRPSADVVLELNAAIAREMAETPGPGELADRIATLIRDMLGCNGVRLHITCAGRARREFTASAGSSSDPNRSTCRHREAVEAQARLTSSHGTEGTLTLSWEDEQHRPLCDADALPLLGAQVVAAMESASRYAESQQRSEMLQTLNEITKDIVGYLEVDQAIEAVMRSATEGLHSTGADIWMREPADSGWRMTFGYNMSQDYLGWQLPLGSMGPSAERLLLGEAFITDDFGAWIRDTPGILDLFPADRDAYLDQMLNSNITIMGVPLWSGSEVSGVLVVYREDMDTRYDRTDADLLVMFGNAASAVLGNARLHSETIKLSEELESRVEERTRDLARATELLRQALDSTVWVQEQERTRIGNDLHDRSCQLIAGALYQLQAAQEAVKKGDSAAAEEPIETAVTLMRGLNAENRKVIEGIHPSVLRRQGLEAAIAHEIESHQQRCAGSWTLRVSGSSRRLAPQEELAAYRIAQEALGNAAKHAEADNVAVLIEYGPAAFTMTVKDDGRGFDPTAAPRDAALSVGLISMHHRAESVGGHLQVGSNASDGTEIGFVLTRKPAGRASA